MFNKSDPHLGRAEYENETLRTKLTLLTEENTQLVQQNQRLLSQLETASRQLQTAHVKVNVNISSWEVRVQLYWSESEWLHSFPSCVFIVGNDKDQREFSLSPSLQYNCILGM